MTRAEMAHCEPLTTGPAGNVYGGISGGQLTVGEAGP